MSHQFELIRPTAEVELLVAAADEFHALARSLDDAGHRAIGLHLHGAASALDRALPQQSGWWSNAFNSQEGRSDLFLRIIGALSPAALVETGTYRGTTTGFMADHFAGPIFTCESDTRWYLTARANLARFPQVNVRNQDSRDSTTSMPTGKRTCRCPQSWS
jgi:predicted O-methyltransferase YrrM